MRAHDHNLTSNDVQLVNQAQGYLDYGYGRFTYLKGVEPIQKFVFQPGVCLSCGAKNNNSDQGVCNGCKEEDYYARCIVCQEGLSEDNYWYHEGEYYCDECFNERFTKCCSCREYYDNDDICYCEDNKRYYCSDCHSEKTFQCYRCEERFHTDKACELDGDYYCPACYENEKIEQERIENENNPG